MPRPWHFSAGKDRKCFPPVRVSESFAVHKLCIFNVLAPFLAKAGAAGLRLLPVPAAPGAELAGPVSPGHGRAEHRAGHTGCWAWHRAGNSRAGHGKGLGKGGLGTGLGTAQCWAWHGAGHACALSVCPVLCCAGAAGSAPQLCKPGCFPAPWLSHGEQHTQNVTGSCTMVWMKRRCYLKVFENT